MRQLLCLESQAGSALLRSRAYCVLAHTLDVRECRVHLRQATRLLLPLCFPSLLLSALLPGHAVESAILRCSLR